MAEPLAGALIAGGASSRFGSAKAELPWLTSQKSLGAHLLDEMGQAGLKTLILNAAHSLHGLAADVRLLADREQGLGPLEGLATVLRELQQPVLVAACDMPGLDTAAFKALAAAWRPDMKGLVARSADGWHPLFAIYSHSLLPEIDRRLALGQRALHRLIEDLGLSAWEGAEPEWLANVNSVEDWETWKARHLEQN